MTAVRANNPMVAEHLLIYRANATLPEPASGSSAVVVAFSQEDASVGKSQNGFFIVFIGKNSVCASQMAKLFLKYGASPDAIDGNGESARSVPRRGQELTDMLAAFDDGDPSRHSISSRPVQGLAGLTPVFGLSRGTDGV